MNQMGAHEYRGKHPQHDRIEQLEGQVKLLREAAEKAATEIRCCDYTPARSTLLVAPENGNEL